MNTYHVGLGSLPWLVRYGVATVSVDIRFDGLSKRVRGMLQRAIKTGYLPAREWSRTGRLMTLIAGKVALPWVSSSPGSGGYVCFHNMKSMPADISKEVREKLLVADETATKLAGKYHGYDRGGWTGTSFYLYTLKPIDHVPPLLGSITLTDKYQVKAGKALAILESKEPIHITIGDG